jgi:hypothetical protein
MGSAKERKRNPTDGHRKPRRGGLERLSKRQWAVVQPVLVVVVLAVLRFGVVGVLSIARAAPASAASSCSSPPSLVVTGPARLSCSSTGWTLSIGAGGSAICDGQRKGFQPVWGADASATAETLRPVSQTQNGTRNG